MTPADQRSELASHYLDQLPYPPYPVQEEALLAWFTAEQGVLVCAPTGTGKTLIAQAALYEALRTNTVAYYTTPLIALTEQKFAEMQVQAVRWGFKAEDVGLVTGNRKVNPNARVLIVVAEILLNRLLHADGYDFSHVSAVVMDEFHSFADPERGIVWELSLNMLPKHVRLLLLSATVGNSVEFISWLDRVHGRKLELVEGRERKIPLTYRWVPDQFLNELLVDIAKGDDATRKTPALVFAFNRDECWSVAEQLKGLDLMNPAQKAALNKECDALDWPLGVGPKLKQMLRRGVGVHHAGLLPKYRRVVEELFEKKLLSVALCTETLAAGINLPARSVVVTSLVKGPFGKEKLIDPSSAHQIFGRAGRPQFDTEGFVFAYPHEDDVRINRWKQQYDQIPENTKDPGLLKAKKALLKKKPARNSQKKYWTETDFERLQNAAPARLYSKGPLPWRLLAYLLKVSPDVEKIRSVVRKRLLDQPRIEAGLKQLNRMLTTLHNKGFVVLDPPPPEQESGVGKQESSVGRQEIVKPEPTRGLIFDMTPTGPGEPGGSATGGKLTPVADPPGSPSTPARPEYVPLTATPTEALDKLLVFRACHPLYGAYLVDLMATASREERLQLLESVLELPRPLLKFVRVPWDLSPGPLQTEKLDPELVAKGLITAKPPKVEGEEEDDEEFVPWDERPPLLAEKARMLFDSQYPEVSDFNTTAVWAAGEVLNYGNFNTFVTTKDLTKQEGLIFRHMLRLILLTEEFEQLTPPGVEGAVWKADLKEIADKLTDICRAVDPTSTEEAIKKAHAADVVEGEEHAKAVTATAPDQPASPAGLTSDEEDAFGAGLIE
ncbi:dead deah box helicase domain protein : Helicase OS=uncultured planctomycete GN=HGMM_F01A04C03 PE=4 SV=1: DEAD: Helicase_C [Gemmataceae bacterium]|nr:dead deah box helicase domain protein : Helicase OS=uncultured planctomycete GN=HGMM_F01A04C03 PE=4 SV=1: DEAD: Helicase_C [Gemmataceae bacterium]VTU02682.1 dead deah box helicase domain protein : Helicase OS=uncultured planctomycete GN=HGMM_F01A04C03 PE=4 SV=1: DEAD: Helicase_C [Gemmataceae bacterium]